jgi:hypothetical protein
MLPVDLCSPQSRFVPADNCDAGELQFLSDVVRGALPMRSRVVRWFSQSGEAFHRSMYGRQFAAR